MNNIKVSVIIPTYHRPLKLKRAIDSVLDQSYGNIEILVIDDNNPNTTYRQETEKLMQTYVDEPKIRYFKHPHNLNGAAARNTGIKASQGEVICFLDDDDYFKPDKTEKQLNYLVTHKDYQAVYCGRHHGNKIVLPTLEGNLMKQLILLEVMLVTPSLMFWKYALLKLGGFDESYRRHQDVELMLRFFESFRIGVLPEALVVIDSEDRSNELHGNEYEKLKEGFLAQFHRSIDYLEIQEKGIGKKIYCKHFVPVLTDHLQNGNVKSALRIYIRFFVRFPLQFHIELIKYIKTYISLQIRLLNGNRSL